MKVISPIDNLAECRSLIDAGADEFYGGFVSPEWLAKFSLLSSLNQRTFSQAQISTRDELVGILDLAHAADIPFSLTLNAPFYTDAQLPALLDYVGDVVSVGVDGIILSDLSLLRLLRQEFPGIELHASTLAHISNSAAVQVYADAGIRRMILQRHLPVAEINAIIQASPNVRFDVFMLVGKCPNSEGLCTFHHSSPEKIWPCEIPYEIEPLSEVASPEILAAIAGQSSWSGTNRRHGCGLCAIPALVRAGVNGAKLVGRGAPAVQKVKNIHLVREFIGLAMDFADFPSYRRRAVQAHHRRFGAVCSPNVCYYPEFYSSE